jgi:predicted nucleic acid-binding protein
MIILDTSYALAMVMPDEARPATMASALETRLVVPSLWPLEVASALRNSVRRGRIKPEQVAPICAALDPFEIEVAAATHQQIFRHYELAQSNALTPYDAAYLELAMQRRCALATLDKALAAAASRLGVRVLS